MQELYNVDNAIANALHYASDKLKNYLLLNPYYYDSMEKINNCTPLVDYETVYTIISLYSDDINNDGTWDDQISEALYTIYPQLF